MSQPTLTSSTPNHKFMATFGLAALITVVVIGALFFKKNELNHQITQPLPSPTPVPNLGNYNIVSHRGLSMALLPASEWQLRGSQPSPDGALMAYIYGFEKGIFDKQCQIWYPTISLVFENIPEEMPVNEYGDIRMEMQRIDKTKLEAMPKEIFPELTEAVGFIDKDGTTTGGYTIASFIYAKQGSTGVQLIAEYPFGEEIAPLATQIVLSLQTAKFGEITNETAQLYTEAAAIALGDGDLRNAAGCENAD